jgi:hypothetical protein
MEQLIRIFFENLSTKKKKQVSLNSDKNNGQFDWKRVLIYGSTSLNSSQNEKYFRQVVQKIKTHFMFSNRLSENRSVPEIMWQNVVRSDRRHLTVQYGACALVAG